MKQIISIFFCLLFSLGSLVLTAQTDNTNKNPFRQLGQELPTPNEYRNAAGAPGAKYFQQKVDYQMDITIDEDKHILTGSEQISYHNNSPDALNYLWLQLDQNVRALDSDSKKIRTSELAEEMSVAQMTNNNYNFDGGFKDIVVTDANGAPLKFVINKTMMRVDLPRALKPGEHFDFKVNWWYNINDRMKIGGRSGYEFFKKENNALYTIAQFFPRLCVYNDVDGWQNKQFLGRGEFTLEFGDYDVRITVPSDHLVAATGDLQNADQVLTATQRKRLDQVKNEFEQPVLIVTQTEAEKNEKGRATDKKTWHFNAKNVRDFAFASSRKFIWDAMSVKQSDGSVVVAASMYPKEGNPLWGKYSTKAVAHTLKWYSHYTFDYPYPIAWSINAAKIGMEYPMICFNYGRCEEDGTYTERIKYGMISVIIHEVGHNYFPMIVNSDERQWTWMDEGLNTFLQYLSERQWERDYPSRRGPAYKIVDYMKGDKSEISPIMTNSESIWQFGNNAYGKPATALNILRETIMGRELFDMAFKTYSKRWMLKQPMPADFFRSMEDASGVDLDWFWRGWFYTTDHCDQSITSVIEETYDDGNPAIKEEKGAEIKSREERYISNIRNKEEIQKTYDEQDPSLRDFYSTYDEYQATSDELKAYNDFENSLTAEEKAALDQKRYSYEVHIENVGNLIMPVILEFKFVDGSSKVVRIPAEIWRFDPKSISKVFRYPKRVEQIVLDPFLETADTDESNNYFPKKEAPISRFKLYKKRAEKKPEPNPMQRANRS